MRKISMYAIMVTLAVGLLCAGCSTGSSSDGSADDGGGGAGTVTQDFESLSLGATLSTMGWGGQTATIIDDTSATGNNLVSVAVTNYNAALIVPLTLPDDATLADYSSFTFKGKFISGDVGYKTIKVYAYSSLPTGNLDYDNLTPIGSFARDANASTSWESLTLDISANTSTLSGTVYLAFGINCAGTGAIGGADSPTVWYADDVSLVP